MLTKSTQASQWYKITAQLQHSDMIFFLNNKDIFTQYCNTPNYFQHIYEQMSCKIKQVIEFEQTLHWNQTWGNEFENMWGWIGQAA